MDFSKDIMDSQGYGASCEPRNGHQTPSLIVITSSSGNYVQMDTTPLPPLWLAYLGDPSDSGNRGN